MTPLRVFIGYDPREAVAYHVLSHSILRRATRPVAIIPLVRTTLGDVYTRPRGPLESTDFSLTRFLVPYLAGYRGHAVYMDCDMLCLTDLTAILAHVGGDARTCPPEAVLVCQHDYTPAGAVKMDGRPQTAYPRKNWSSLMVFNTERCRALTPAYVNTASGLELHRFQWLNDEQIGALPLEWNWLVGEYGPNPFAKILHYTLGGPWFPEWRDSAHAKEWFAEREAMVGDG
jgi:hypothetical protein